MIWPFLLEKTANKYVHTVANALFVWFALLVVDKKSINFVSRMFLMLHYDLIFESEIKKPNVKREKLIMLTNLVFDKNFREIQESSILSPILK